jgi:hypothetical protein
LTLDFTLEIKRLAATGSQPFASSSTKTKVLIKNLGGFAAWRFGDKNF